MFRTKSAPALEPEELRTALELLDVGFVLLDCFEGVVSHQVVWLAATHVHRLLVAFKGPSSYSQSNQEYQCNLRNLRKLKKKLLS